MISNQEEIQKIEEALESPHQLVRALGRSWQAVRCIDRAIMNSRSFAEFQQNMVIVKGIVDDVVNGRV